ncbi:MAG: M20/M25/M40 family metallo-hydrolase, partial [Nitrospiria bacterium]
PTNIVKGKWPVLRSPMSIRVRQADGQRVQSGRGKLSPRPRYALAALPPAISGGRMMKDIDLLTGSDLKGRGFLMPELDLVADYIAEAFRKAGLKTAGDLDNSYIQAWKEHGGGLGSEVPLKNVVGFIPGSRPEWAGQSVVVGAHYDHLGFGWPDVHRGDEGKIHPGADDNASGIAVLLELARALGKGRPLERSVVFVAFTAGEVERLGSRHFISQPKPFTAGRMMGMVNIDTVGRLEDRDLIVFGAGSAREWAPLFREAGFITGVPIAPNASERGASDQVSFLNAGIPAVQVFSGVTPDLRRPTDTTDKIDPVGLAKVVKVVKEVVEHLATRPEPLTLLWNR